MTTQEPVKLSDLDGVTLTASQGFCAMAKFLSGYFDRTSGSGPVRTLVGDVELEDDGSSVDPAALGDWMNCVSEVLAEDEK
jgi:hypothetical protein